jgi:hypothetical protein
MIAIALGIGPGREIRTPDQERAAGKPLERRVPTRDTRQHRVRHLRVPLANERIKAIQGWVAFRLPHQPRSVGS